MSKVTSQICLRMYYLSYLTNKMKIFNITFIVHISLSWPFVSSLGQFTYICRSCNVHIPQHYFDLHISCKRDSTVDACFFTSSRSCSNSRILRHVTHTTKVKELSFLCDSCHVLISQTIQQKRILNTNERGKNNSLERLNVTEVFAVWTCSKQSLL